MLLISCVSECFQSKNLSIHSPNENNFSQWKLTELKESLKLAGRLKGLSNTKIDKLVEVVTTL